jgi:hypothetical protein
MAFALSSKVVSGVTLVRILGQIGRPSMISSSSSAEFASTMRAKPMTPLIGPPARIFPCASSVLHSSGEGRM